MLRFKNIPKKKPTYEIGDRVVICSSGRRVRHMYKIGTICKVIAYDEHNDSCLVLVGMHNGMAVQQYVCEEDVNLFTE